MLNVATVPAQGEDLLLKVSEDNGENWLTLVCLVKQGFEFTRNVNETNTQCGQLIGKGTPSMNIPVEGAVNITEDATLNGAGFASYKKMQTWAKDFTPLIVKHEMPENDNTGFKNQVNAYLVDLKLDAPVDNICTFSATLRGWGTWTIN